MTPAQLSRGKALSKYMKEPNFNRSLCVSDRAKLQAEVDNYQYFTSGTGKIEMKDYQRKAVRSATKNRAGLWSGEMWTGAGKSYVAAWIAKEFMPFGKTIFVCPNTTGMGNGVGRPANEEKEKKEAKKSGGIIYKFAEIFNPRDLSGKILAKYETALSALNGTDTNDVYFFTPHGLVSLRKNSPALFQKIVSAAHALIIDEAHHFPGESYDHVIYDKISLIAKEDFLSKRKKVVTLTATHGRADGKLLIGKPEPDFRMTVQEGVNIGRCPEIHGLRVQLSTKAPNARAVGDLFDLKLRGKALGKYLQEVAGRMISIQGKNKNAKICAFVRTVNEARFLAGIWDAEAKKRGFLPIAVLVGDTTQIERDEIKNGILGGKYQGFVTCNVGSESIDIPPLEIVHMIRRTKSVPILVQSVGRALRMDTSKRRALIVDYHVMEARIIRACKGLADYAVYAGRTPSKKYLFDRIGIEEETVNGGPLIVPDGKRQATLPGTTVAQEKAWVIKNIGIEDNDELDEVALFSFIMEKLQDKKKPIYHSKEVAYEFRGKSYTRDKLRRILDSHRRKLVAQ